MSSVAVCCVFFWKECSTYTASINFATYRTRQAPSRLTLYLINPFANRRHGLEVRGHASFLYAPKLFAQRMADILWKALQIDAAASNKPHGLTTTIAKLYKNLYKSDGRAHLIP
jgi:hypothetical protein